MNELQILTVDSDNKTVSARELHEKLNIGTQYTKWFERMCDYGFVSGEDYEAISQKRLTAQGNETTYTDHNISMDMAKQICMIQRTPEGKAVRQYLIDLEKAWNTPEQVMARALRLADKTIASLNQRVIEQDKRIMIQDSVINEMKPNVSYYDMILDNKSTVLVTQIAQDYGMSAKGFNKMLKDMGVQHKVGGQWILYSRYQGNGYVHSKTFDFERSNGIKDVNMNTEWTQKGRLFLYDFLKKHNILPLIEREI